MGVLIAETKLRAEMVASWQCCKSGRDARGKARNCNGRSGKDRAQESDDTAACNLDRYWGLSKSRISAGKGVGFHWDGRILTVQIVAIQKRLPSMHDAWLAVRRFEGRMAVIRVGKVLLVPMNRWSSAVKGMATLLKSGNHLRGNFFKKEVGDSLIDRIAEGEAEIEAQNCGGRRDALFKVPIIDEILEKIRPRDVNLNGASLVERDNAGISLRKHAKPDG